MKNRAVFGINTLIACLGIASTPTSALAQNAAPVFGARSLSSDFEKDFLCSQFNSNRLELEKCIRDVVWRQPTCVEEHYCRRINSPPPCEPYNLRSTLQTFETTNSPYKIKVNREISGAPVDITFTVISSQGDFPVRLIRGEQACLNVQKRGEDALEALESNRKIESLKKIDKYR
jgi:hypothetical protein